jgi:acetolactate decarboxylase
MPEFEQGISVAGYYSHFIDKDRDRGGHALDDRLVRGKVEISARGEFAIPRFDFGRR